MGGLIAGCYFTDQLTGFCCCMPLILPRSSGIFVQPAFTLGLEFTILAAKSTFLYHYKSTLLGECAVHVLSIKMYKKSLTHSKLMGAQKGITVVINTKW